VSVRSFMLEFRTETSQVAELRDERFWWNDSVIIKITAHRTWVELNRISSQRHGCGHGSAALAWFCALADKHGVSVHGIAAPFGDSWLSRASLIGWYRRHGFKVTESATDTYIDRAPVTSRMLLS